MSHSSSDQFSVSISNILKLFSALRQIFFFFFSYTFESRRMNTQQDTFPSLCCAGVLKNKKLSLKFMSVLIPNKKANLGWKAAIYRKYL